MKIVYLDQNKWVALTQAAKHPSDHPELHALLAPLEAAVLAGRLALPLTATNIFETWKVNIPERRQDLASVQAALSRGLVFRGRHKRLEVEVSRVAREVHGLPPVEPEPKWFLSGVFFEAFLEVGDPRLGFAMSEKVLKAIRRFPDRYLYDHLANAPDEMRIEGARRFSEGSEQLRQRVERRRASHAGESISMRRNIYSVFLLDDEMELILAIAQRAQVPWGCVSDIGEKAMRRIPLEVPAYDVEREITVKLETQKRPIEENDFRDMQSFCAVVPYADEVIAERQFTNLARQAGLGRKYGTELSTNIFRLKEYL